MTKNYAGIGARTTPPDICEILTGVASSLQDFGWTLRTGGAQGADLAFFQGISDLDFIEISIPWEGFQGFTSQDKPVTNLNAMAPSLKSSAYALAEEHHPNWDALSDGGKALMARNSLQIFGLDLETPVDLVICWTPKGEIVGGTGQALRMAKAHDIQVINLGSQSIEEAETIIGSLLEEVPPF